jgi:TM2 domain-containing membrane protein YozV
VDTGLTPPELTRKVDYAGITLSTFIPGSGQAYQSRYVMGGLFLAAEAGAIGFAAYWNNDAGLRRSDARRFRDAAGVLNELGGAAGIDSAVRAAYLYEAGRYSVIADEADFGARESKNTFYNALAWAVGLHIYNALDALEAGGLTARGLERNPTAAGFLAAVPFLGLGQFYNERPAKAGMLAMTQAGLALTAYNQHRLMGMASGKYNQMRDSASAQYAYRAEHLNYWKSRYDNAFSSRNTYLWLSLAAYLYSIFDAVVDAYLSDFNANIDIGTDLSAAPVGGGAAVSVTVGLKWPPQR